jgi:uncharacterized protein (DUF4415 family)
MSKKRTSSSTPKSDAPYDPKDRKATLNFWKEGVAHKGVAQLRAKRGRPPMAAGERKEQIALRLDADVLAWYRAMGTGWQTRMNAVLRAFRDASE